MEVNIVESHLLMASNLLEMELSRTPKAANDGPTINPDSRKLWLLLQLQM